ncbi:imidazole glycerol phosphate synthase subunit HisF [Sphingomicrobium astaxanthinifaciens]|uniref:imidazole glycerol phosphate synthase subunit HisF n=1 Tax=Sphingomicrobium astaxanthinifaciens TaxID=1227949 RepID=UPI001FCC5880|nr:imidazole glycerol phosphate synthase subunit HisF [Sphingomicrobium astaxanthinifaciens]MCJ7421211.1 imidazole glycerol phosphate synthase subunit HisF [Sphingomicrobium astaxanthinifaciens]
MPAARIIPCLDVANGVVVKGVQFRDHRVIGDIVENAQRYADEGADELVFYDITASADGRSVDVDWVHKVARVIDIPFSVAGGIDSVDKAAAVLGAGADKVSVNSPALADPELITRLADAFGRQCVVLGLDSFTDEQGVLRVKALTGRPDKTMDVGRETIDWAREAVARGAGEIVLNAMNNDGVRQGYDLVQLEALCAAVDVPVIASGGAGTPEHFAQAFAVGCSGALAASVFHDQRIAIGDLKDYLDQQGLEVRR